MIILQRTKERNEREEKMWERKRKRETIINQINVLCNQQFVAISNNRFVYPLFVCLYVCMYVCVFVCVYYKFTESLNP